MPYYPVKIQQLNPTTEAWTDLLSLHAIKVNKKGGNETFNAAADQYHPTLVFTFRWMRALEAVAYNPQQHRLVYRGHTFDICDYDDFMEQHLTVTITGVCYG